MSLKFLPAVLAACLTVLCAEETAPEVKIFPDDLSAAQWIWHSGEGKRIFCRMKVRTEGPVKKAAMRFFVENGLKFFVNGSQVSGTAAGYDFAKFLKPGENLIALESPDSPQRFGIIFRCDLVSESGSTGEIVSCRNVKVSGQEAPGWFLPGFDDSGWTPAVEKGCAALYPGGIFTNLRLRRFTEDLIGRFASEKEQVRFREYFRKSYELDPALAERFRKDPPCRASVVWKNGYSFINVNGKLYSPVLRLSLRPGTLQSDDFIFRMKNSSMKFYQIMLDTDSLYTHEDMWRGTGNYNFLGMESRVSRLLKMNPDAYVFIDLYFAQMRKWCEQNPEETMRYASGEIQDDSKISGDETRGRHLRPTPASEVFRAEVVRVLTAMCNDIKKQPWANRIVGIRGSFGVTAEWMYFGSACEMPDTSRPMTEKFRVFLKKRYGTDSALQAAWHTPGIKISEVLPPDGKERAGAGLFFRDSSTKERKAMDFYDCMHETLADLALLMGKTVKENLPGRLFGTYDGYEVGKLYPPEGEHALTEKLLASPYIDFLSAPYNYTAAVRRGGGSGLPVHIPSTFERYRKLSFLEADIRTHLAKGATPIKTLTPAETDSVIRRDVCNALLNRAGIQFAQFGGTYEPDWFNTEQMRRTLDQCIKIDGFLRENTAPHSISETAVIYDSTDFRHHGFPTRVLPFLQELKFSQLNQMYFTGHVFDLMSMNDFLESKRNYRNVVFLNTFTVTKELNARLQKKLRRPGVTAFWTYAPGLLTGNGFSDANMKDVTGIELKTVWKKLPYDMTLGNQARIFIPDGSRKPWLQSPRVFCADPEPEVLARYSDDGTPAAVRKKLADGSTSVFLGIPVTSTGFWTQLLKDCGSRAWTKQGQMVRANSCLILVHSRTSGLRTVTLPEPAAGVVDVFRKKLIGENVRTFSFDDPENTTSLFYYGKDWREILAGLNAHISD